jgi:hypothetical protein
MCTVKEINSMNQQMCLAKGVQLREAPAWHMGRRVTHAQIHCCTYLSAARPYQHTGDAPECRNQVDAQDYAREAYVKHYFSIQSLQQ